MEKYYKVVDGSIVWVTPDEIMRDIKSSKLKPNRDDLLIDEFLECVRKVNAFYLDNIVTNTLVKPPYVDGRNIVVSFPYGNKEWSFTLLKAIIMFCEKEPNRYVPFNKDWAGDTIHINF